MPRDGDQDEGESGIAGAKVMIANGDYLDGNESRGPHAIRHDEAIRLDEAQCVGRTHCMQRPGRSSLRFILALAAPAFC